MPEKQNLLVVIVDQLRADCVSGALAKHVDLPNIAAFRREAVTFENHFSVTSPCGPSRASLFTGRYTMNHRSLRNGTPLAHDTPNIARELRKSDYEPLLFGYTDTSQDPNFFHPDDPDLKTEEAVMPGFREVLEMRYLESYPWRADLKAKGYDIPDFENFYHPVAKDPSREAKLDDPPFYSAKDSDTAFLTNELIKHLSVKAGQTWCAFATYIRPHPPLVAPEPYNKMYNPHDLPLPNRMASLAQERARHVYIDGAAHAPSIDQIVRGFNGKLDAGNDNHVQTLRALYLGLATEVDVHFGRVIQFLKDSGQYEKTIVVFTSDHGEMLGDHHLWGKETPFDPSFRIPLVIRDPRNPAEFGKSVDSFTESVDLMPTILNMVAQMIPTGLDGRSLGAFLSGGPVEDWRNYVHLELDFGAPDHPTSRQLSAGTDLRNSNMAILRESRFKLVHFNGGLPPMLFDLQDDPHEMQDLAADPAHAATLLRLTQKLLNHKMRHGVNSLTDVKIRGDGAWNFKPQ